MNSKSMLRDIDECIRTIQYIWIASQGDSNQVRWPKLISLLMDISKFCKQYKDKIHEVAENSELENESSTFVEPKWWARVSKGKKR